MRKGTLAATLIVLFIMAALPVLAATTQPRSSMHPGMWAAGGDLGLANPTGDGDFDTDPQLGAFLERFTSDHISWRGMLTTASAEDPRFDPSSGRDVDITAVNGNVLYTWEGGYWHPFVTGGLGMYDYDDTAGDGDVEVGTNLGGGVNLFMTRTAALKFEGLLHATTSNIEPDSYFSATGGVRFQW